MTAEGSAVPKEKPRPKRRPPALPEDRQRLKEQWPLICNEIEDPSLKNTLKNVEIEFKEDEFAYLVCAMHVYEELIKKKLDVIAAAIEKVMEKSFELRTTTKEEYDTWRDVTYGKPEVVSEWDEEDWNGLDYAIGDYADCEE